MSEVPLTGTMSIIAIVFGISLALLCQAVVFSFRAAHNLQSYVFGNFLVQW